ncbi:hypothetical protein A3A74_04665 [Candidatus Roizmanbacteria bacterium RIFCSPLOWO2_01_FULL_35_13]|uniref:Uncharacterized protein n=1 Tax=Candidatus Roizmanbacteria bacterium RIFCSPLOWO2_01_FULL_35_13 TaxID=1802055 RepID=A0A1F7IF34_9BACT|nr:MAG: hypothetical protein A3A74_04665 [Candidatus Roizmanbacteria bacterium RIFCSPLOWO2_01_FULL_35_13]
MTRYLLITFIAVIFIFLYYLTQPPFVVSDDMAFEKNYKKRAIIDTKDDFFTSFTRYSKESKRFLDSFEDAELVAFRCSDNILRSIQGAYILKNAKTERFYRRTIKNNDFIAFMRNKEKTFPPGKKMLTSRVCETENKTILLFYTLGKYDSSNLDNNTILQTIHDSTENEAIVQIIPANFVFGTGLHNISRSRANLICDEPFHIGKNDLLYILCTEEFPKSSGYYISEINLNTGSSRILKKCLNLHGTEIKTTCD